LKEKEEKCQQNIEELQNSYQSVIQELYQKLGDSNLQLEELRN
jgi:hypothetical protein